MGSVPGSWGGRVCSQGGLNMVSHPARPALHRAKDSPVIRMWGFCSLSLGPGGLWL